MLLTLTEIANRSYSGSEDYQSADYVNSFIVQKSYDGGAVLITTNEDDYSFRGKKFQLNKVITVPVGGIKIAIDPTACTEVLFEPPMYIASADLHKVVKYSTTVIPTGGTQLYGHCTNHILNTIPKLAILFGVTSTATPTAEADEYLAGSTASGLLNPGGGMCETYNVHIMDTTKYSMIEIENATTADIDWQISFTWYE